MRSHCVKCPNTEFFLVRVFLHSNWIRKDTPYLSVFSPNAGNYGPEKTPYLGTFQAVSMMAFLVSLLLFFSMIFSHCCSDCIVYFFVLPQSAFICSKTNVSNIFEVSNKVIDVVLVFLLSSLNIFQTSLCCFHIWLWASKYLVRIT